MVKLEETMEEIKKLFTGYVLDINAPTDMTVPTSLTTTLDW